MKNILHILATTSLCTLLPASSATCSQPRHDNNQKTVVACAQQSANTRSVSMQKTDNKPTFRILEEWQVGKEVSAEDVRKYGTDRCFVSMPISDAVFGRIYGNSYKKDCRVLRSSLRYLHLLHYTEDGRIKLGEMICHKDIADDLTDIFRKLFEAKYPIENMQLIDNYGADDIRSMEHNNTTCFNYRTVAGSKKLSNHSLGKAVDINPLYNPYVKRRKDGTYKVSPEKGRLYADRTKTFKYKIDRNDLAYRLFKQHGFRWGGDYRSLKDYQHFEKEDRI